MSTVAPKPQSRLLWATLLVVFAMVMIAVLIGQAVLHEIERQTQEKVERYRREWLTAQMADLKSGKTDGIHFYDTESTDEGLEEFRGMPEVRALSFTLTDVSNKGMDVVAGFPRLRSLVLYGGYVDDDGLGRLAGNETLERLKLVNTMITDDGLKVLKTLPNLRSLTLFRETRLEVTLTDAGLLQLQYFDHLEELNISGGWASDAAIQKLQAALPNCKISTTEFSD